MFVSSHLLAEVEHLADDVIVIDRGALITHGSLAELQQSVSLVRTSEPDRLADELTAASATTQTQGNDGLIVRGISTDQIGERAFAAGIILHELSPHAGSLEELFLRWTNDQPTNGEKVIQL